MLMTCPDSSWPGRDGGGGRPPAGSLWDDRLAVSAAYGTMTHSLPNSCPIPRATAVTQLFRVSLSLCM